MRIKIALFLLTLSLLSFAAPLPQEEAFRLNISIIDANMLHLNWKLKPGYFLYQQRIWIENDKDTYLNIGNIQYPQPQIKLSKQGEQVLVYGKALDLNVPVLAHLGGEFLIQIHYQGCSDEGYCYPPQIKTIKLSFDKEHMLNQINFETDFAEEEPQINDLVTAQNAKVQSLFANANPFLIIISFFGFGLLLAFTPCVLPMVPVLSSIIVGHGHKISTRKAFLLSLIYVLSMALTYGLIGAIIAKLGANLQIIMQSPWIIGSFSALFIALALSMFDVYHFRLPLAWQNCIASVTRSHEGGHYLNSALMGAISILVLSPCVTPPLIGALTYIAESGSAFLGLLALFFLGLGMGLPLLLIGTSAGKLLPKTGLWMNTVKYIFGMLLLGLAIHMLSRLVSPFISMILWSALFIVCGLGLKPFFPQKTGRSFLLQALGMMLIIYGGFILYGASAGHTNPWQPLAQTTAQSTTTFSQTVHSMADAQQALTQAKTDHKPVFLDFYASWCDNCQVIEKTILQSEQIAALQDQIVMLRIDLSKNDAEAQALLKYFNIIAPPTFLFYDALGNPMPQLKWVGTIEMPTLVSSLQAAIRTSEKP